ncbi:MAG: FGGY-family carbohydrate kinase [Synechococcaceae cyanobacterium]|nr:FGGY-family carbohydrate kinase [Synechococcaceae cyanobacterium]
MSRLALGLDFGTSGLRAALVDPGGRRLEEVASPYGRPFEEPAGWLETCTRLLDRFPREERSMVGAIALDGTSGTLLACRPDGRLLPGAPGRALPYHRACPEQAGEVQRLTRGEGEAGPAASSSGSLARALHLLAGAEAAGERGPLLLRHQADWVMGWLLGDWRWGEEGNNLRLGWLAGAGRWAGRIADQPWADALPRIRTSGSVVGTLAPERAADLGLHRGCLVVAGTTDANAGVLAASPQDDDGVTVLGTTLVLKRFVPAPIRGPGVSCHRVAGRWLAGGASNAGAGVLRRFYDDAMVHELSRQIDPRRDTGLMLRPLPRPGERFPVDDPTLEPVLEPRPVSDALYLQALLEGLGAIEAAGWRRLVELGAPPVGRVLTLGGGARNPQWRMLRERMLGVPVLNRPSCTAALGMALLARGRMGVPGNPPP